NLLNSMDGHDDLKLNKFDIPLLVGLNILEPEHIFAVPALQYILVTELEDVKLEDVKNDLTIGFQIGAGVNLSEELGLDIRYERGFSENEAKFVGNDAVERRIDTRPSQIILGLSYKFYRY